MMARRTKIIATIGPASEDEATLRNLVRAGMDVARLGLAHGTLDEAAERLTAIRRIAAEEGRPVGILVDLPGPKVRAASFGDDSVPIVEKSEIRLTVGSGCSTASVMEVDYESLLDDVLAGDRLSIGDGRVILEVSEVGGDQLVARVMHGGFLSGCPGVHVPSDRLSITAPAGSASLAPLHRPAPFLEPQSLHQGFFPLMTLLKALLAPRVLYTPMVDWVWL